MIVSAWWLELESGYDWGGGPYHEGAAVACSNSACNTRGDAKMFVGGLS